MNIFAYVIGEASNTVIEHYWFHSNCFELMIEVVNSVSSVLYNFSRILLHDAAYA